MVNIYTLDIFGISISLINKESPYDNVVNEVMKTEFIYQKRFNKLVELKLELSEFVYWYNNYKIHGSLSI
ncbi:IS3 family transposase [uncultured Anaerococcus sp.]|uniref:IS3 family transposase n=1 Tax=uncultured Anaerococcus sp. TaxID=293428 RepID=UPI00345B29DE